MKRFLALIIAIVLSVSCVVVYADEAELTVGEVLYHQDFADVGEFGNTGIRLGTLSSSAAEYGCAGEYFTVQTKDSGRVYMILPETPRTSSYTVEFSFKFTDASNPGGYLAFMLTCRGEEPANITSLVFRADGTIDDFSAMPTELAAAITAGEDVQVKIPVENNILHHISVTVGGTEYTFERDSMLVISDGGMGFLYRHAGAAVREIYIVNGVGYSEKTGEFADSSYATDDKPVITPDNPNNNGAPVTADMGFVVPVVLVSVSAAALAVLAMAGGRKRRHE